MELHNRFAVFVGAGVFVVATMVVFGYVARPWAYQHADSDGLAGALARGLLVTTG